MKKIVWSNLYGDSIYLKPGKSKFAVGDKVRISKYKRKVFEYLVTGQEFKKLTRNAKKLGAESLDYSTRKNNKYMATLPSGKKVHFGSPKYPDYTIHKDKEKRDKYLTRATKIKNKQGDLTYTNPESANFWSVHLLWPKK